MAPPCDRIATGLPARARLGLLGVRLLAARRGGRLHGRRAVASGRGLRALPAAPRAGPALLPRLHGPRRQARHAPRAPRPAPRPPLPALHHKRPQPSSRRPQQITAARTCTPSTRCLRMNHHAHDRPVIVHEGIPGHWAQFSLSWRNPREVRTKKGPLHTRTPLAIQSHTGPFTQEPL